MKAVFTLLAGAAALAQRAAAVPTWPSPALDEIEDIMFLRFGYNSRQFSNGVTPCSSSPDGTSRSAAAEWIRTAFHDMATAQHYTPPFVGGIDASLMFETDRGENVGVAFTSTLTTYAPFFNSRASMADLIALGVFAATRSCGGPAIPMRAGRVDATQADASGVPEPQNPTLTLFSQFARAGFSQSEAIQLTACGHTVGGVHAADFPLIVPAGTQKGDYGLCDGTGFVFDNRILTEYLAGTSTDPMTVGISVANGRNSDGRMFAIDNNATVTAMSTPDAFSSTCSTVFQKMIETVPPVSTLSDVITPYEVKPNSLQLTLLSGGLTLTFSGQIRVRTTVRPASQIASVAINYLDRNGATGGTIATKAVGTATGFDDSFSFYSFSATIDSTLSISSFVVVITGTGGDVVKYDNNGGGFPIQDSIFYLNPQSCIAPNADANNNRPVTLVAAVRGTLTAPTVTMNIVLRNKRTDIPNTIAVPKLQTVATTMTFVNTVGPYNIYTGTYALAYDLSRNAEFDVTVVSGNNQAIDPFKNTGNLPAFCGAALGGAGAATTTPGGTTTTPGGASVGATTTPGAATTTPGAAPPAGTTKTAGAATTTPSGPVVVGASTPSNGGASNTTPTSFLSSAAATSSSGVSGWTAMGCFTDDVNARSLNSVGVPGGFHAMTNELCQATCLAAGFILAGTEFSGECYCGSTIKNAGGPAPDGNALCNMPCNGNGAEICGGPNRLSLYGYGTAASTVPGWTALGCYTDNVQARGLSNLVQPAGGSLVMTIESCLSACNAAGYTLAGVEFGGECYCDNTVKNGQKKAPDGNALCNMACHGNGGQICGGPNRLNVYSYAPVTGAPAVPDTVLTKPVVGAYSYLGCYSDNVLARALTSKAESTGTMTQENCAKFCAGFTYFGTEYSYECYCGNNLVGSTKEQMTDCLYTCAGDPTEFCGGSSRLSVYKLT